MGMFDNITCKYPLPLPQYQTRQFQTKDTSEQSLDNYEIREDGTLWHEAYDTEDKSEAGKWMNEHPGEKLPETFGLKEWCGLMTPVNKRWERVKDFTGEIRFYMSVGESGWGWVEFSAYFVNGELNQIHVIEHKPA